MPIKIYLTCVPLERRADTQCPTLTPPLGKTNVKTFLLLVVGKNILPGGETNRDDETSRPADLEKSTGTTTRGKAKAVGPGTNTLGAQGTNNSPVVPGG